MTSTVHILRMLDLLVCHVVLGHQAGVQLFGQCLGFTGALKNLLPKSQTTDVPVTQRCVSVGFGNTDVVTAHSLGTWHLA